MNQNNLNKTDEIYSSATIKSHPIHPMIVVFPIATLIGAFVTDIVYLLTKDSFWAYASYWLVMAAVITGIGAALFGLIDFVMNSRIRSLRSAWFHAIGNVFLMSFAVINLLIRNDDYVNAIFPWGIALSAVSVLTLSFTAWHGGELVYRHKVGIDSRNTEKETIAEPRIVAERADLS